MFLSSGVLDEDLQWLQWAEKQFIEIAGEDQQIDLDEFKRALNVKKVQYLFLHKKFCLETEYPAYTKDNSYQY